MNFRKGIFVNFRKSKRDKKKIQKTSSVLKKKKKEKTARYIQDIGNQDYARFLNSNTRS